MPEKKLTYFHNLASEVNSNELELSPFEEREQSNAYVEIEKNIKQKDNPVYTSSDVVHEFTLSPSKWFRAILYVALLLSLIAVILAVMALTGVTKEPLDDSTADSRKQADIKNFINTLQQLVGKTETHKEKLKMLQNKLQDMIKEMKGQKTDSELQNQRQKSFILKLNILQQNFTSQLNTSHLLNDQISNISKELKEQRRESELQIVQQESFQQELYVLQKNITSQLNKSHALNDQVTLLDVALNTHESKLDFLFYLEGLTHVNDTIYVISKIKLTWDESKAYCEQSNMTLVRIHSKEENDYLRKELMKRKIPKAYIGLHDTRDESKFVWVDGTQLDYKNWYPGEPNNLGDEDCVSMYDTGFWYDFKCSEVIHFICMC